MAITTTPLSSDLIIHVEKDGGAGTIARKFANLKTDALDQDVFNVGTVLAGLQSKILAGVNRSQIYEIESV